MRSADQPEFAAILSATFVGVYQKPAPSPDVIGIWFAALSDFDLTAVRRALSLHVRDPDRGQYPPRPADITRFVEGSTQTQGMAAWAKVERAMRCVGGYQTVVFDDPLIHTVISEMGDWPSLCQTELRELPFRARDFERRYAAYRSMRQNPTCPPSLTGITEAERRTSGLPLPEPVLIGDTERARRLLSNPATGVTTDDRERRTVASAVQSLLDVTKS